MTIYSSDGEVYDTPLHHELEMPQSMLQPAEEGPVRVAGKKSYEPPPIKKPPTLPPLEPLTDPGNPPRGQYGPPGIEYPPWTVERPFVGSQSDQHVAMNDNIPPLPLDITMPNIQGGLRKPPKPANDNDSRKPLKFSTVDNKQPSNLEKNLIEGSYAESIQQDFEALNPQIKDPNIKAPTQRGDWESEVMTNLPPKGYLEPKDTMKDYKKYIEEKRDTDRILEIMGLPPPKEKGEKVIPGQSDYIRSKDLGKPVLDI